MSTFTQLFNVSQSGMRLNMLDMDTVSNNLANINTDGYKSTRLNFQELLTDATLEGARLASHTTDTTEGSLKNTGRNMDWAISGEGYFALRQPNGQIAYTRSGNFQLDANQNILSTDGIPLVWNGTLPSTAQDVQIDSNGNVTYLNSGDEIRYTAGQVSLYRFSNPSGLLSEGDNLSIATPSSGAAISGLPNTNGLGSTVGSTLENSNVSLSQELSRMIIIQRIFQTTSSALTQSNQMLTGAIQMRS